jgi:hypothetical protein
MRVTPTGVVALGGSTNYAYLPAMMPDGRLGFVTNVTTRGPNGDWLPTDYQVIGLDLATHEEGVLLHQPLDITGLAFGPKGAIAVAELSAGYKAYSLEIVHSDGSTNHVPLAGPSFISWSSDRRLLVGDFHTSATEVLREDGSVIATLEGWRGLAWSPDNKQILVTRGTDVGLWTLGNGRPPTRVGSVTSPAQVFAAAWLPTDPLQT